MPYEELPQSGPTPRLPQSLAPTKITLHETINDKKEAKKREEMKKEAVPCSIHRRRGFEWRKAAKLDCQWNQEQKDRICYASKRYLYFV